jgi:hypothetical protein
MSVDRVLPYYVGICIVSLFTGIAYETDELVVRPFDVMVGVALIFTVAAAARRGYARRLNKGLPYYLFAALYLYRGLSGFVMTGPVLAVKELIQGFEFLVLIHLVAQAVKGKENRLRFLQTLYVGFGVVALGTALLHISDGKYSGYKYLPGGEQKYAFGLFGLMAAVFWASDRDRWYTFPVFGLALLLTLLSGERKGWVALAAAGVGMYYVASDFRIWGIFRNIFRARSIAVAVVLIAALYMGYNYGYSREQLEGLKNTYNLVIESEFDYVYSRGQDVGRYNGLVFISNTLSRHPMFGVGTERGKEAVEEIPNPGVSIATGHGEYQRYALENGLLGLFLYAAAWILILVRAIRYSRRLLRRDHLASIFTIGFIVYSVVVNMFMGGGAHNIMFMAVSIGFLYCHK